MRKKQNLRNLVVFNYVRCSLSALKPSGPQKSQPHLGINSMEKLNETAVRCEFISASLKRCNERLTIPHTQTNLESQLAQQKVPFTQLLSPKGNLTFMTTLRADIITRTLQKTWRKIDLLNYFITSGNFIDVGDSFLRSEKIINISDWF